MTKHRVCWLTTNEISDFIRHYRHFKTVSDISHAHLPNIQSQEMHMYDAILFDTTHLFTLLLYLIPDVKPIIYFFHFFIFELIPRSCSNPSSKANIGINWSFSEAAMLPINYFYCSF